MRRQLVNESVARAAGCYQVHVYIAQTDYVVGDAGIREERFEPALEHDIVVENEIRVFRKPRVQREPGLLVFQ